MRSNRAAIEVGTLACLLVFGTPALAQEAFVRPTDRVATLAEDRSVSVVRATNVVVDVEQLNAGNRTVTIAAFNMTFEVELGRIEPIPGRGFIWYGQLVKPAGGSVIVTVVGGIASANIETRAGRAYQIRYRGGGVYSFREIDRSKFPDESTPRAPRGPPPAPPPPPTPPPPPGSCADSQNDIDVMVVYTPAARMAAAGKDAMEGLIYLAIAEANQSYFNSEITQRLRLVHVEEVSYTESNSYDVDLDHLQNGSDNVMDNVQTLRDTFAADVVSLITEYPVSAGLSCGEGNVMAAGFVGPSFESLAYSVVSRECATGNFSLAHEIGHNMGAHHVIGNGAYPYSHGFVKLTPTDPTVGPWRTVMADQTFPVASTRVAHFSNPSVNYPSVGGDATGIAGVADNHLTLNNTASIVANFRCSSPGAPNVWMKDTWNDTGAEPDPLTAGEDMWKSPYIWVRNTQDTNLIHQHEHENPVFGSTNWVYVKMQNGSAAAADGKLEVYWANASTALAWPTDWTLLSSVAVSNFPGHSTQIIEIPWANLPGTGHYCLVARWNSPMDPMATAEGPDIDPNVRANNNLVWRNLHIVALAGAPARASVRVANPDDGDGGINLVIRASDVPGKPSFLATGGVIVQFDDALLKAWRAGGAHGGGFKVQGNRFIVGPEGASFDNLRLSGRLGGRLELEFRMLPTTPRRDFVVDVVQTRSDRTATARGLSRLVGAVSYEIHADH